MKTLDGLYRGIVVQNNDPDRLGRVKVFVPHLHLSLIDDLEPSDYDGEFYFSDFGTNYNPKDRKYIDLTKYIDILKLKLPWAEMMLPVVGAGFSSFNSPSNRATVSDSAQYINQIEEDDNSTGAPEGSLYKEYLPRDQFAQNSENVHPLGSSYTTTSYMNGPKGMFGIPQVNTKVWLFFVDGNPNMPVIMGCSPSPTTYKEIYDDSSYPSGYENNDPGEGASAENLKRRNRAVINYKGGSITFNETDNEEAVSIAHDIGSFSEFNNSGQNNLIIGRRGDLIKGDAYTTIEGFQAYHCVEHAEATIGGDLKILVGSGNYAAAQRWKEAAANIHAVKSLPELKITDNESFYSSPLAERSGTYAPCPACKQGKKNKTYLGGIGDQKNLSLMESLKKSFEETLTSFFNFFGGARLIMPDVKLEEYPPVDRCPVCKGTGESPSTMGGEWEKDERKEQIGELYLNSAQEFFEAENALGNGGGVDIRVTKDFTLSCGMASNDFDSVHINKQGASHNHGLKLDPEFGLYSEPVVTSTVEINHVDKFPGGQVTIDAMNGLCLQGGSGGCDINTTGVLSMFGTVAEFTGEQVNLSSRSGLNIATKESLSLNAANVVIEGSSQTLMKGNVGIDGNMECTGGMMIQGEMYVQHITAPLSFQQTEYHPELYGKAYQFKQLKVSFLRRGETFSALINGNTATVQLLETVPTYSIDGGQQADDGSIYCYPHYHTFRNAPMTLTGTYEEARQSAFDKGMNGSEPVAAEKIENGLTAPKIPYVQDEKVVGLENQLGAPKYTPLKIGPGRRD